ncbi:hypothetical protein DFQ10_10143 [Winogradskyella eximia]|uniref:Uncharacterized protein n=1 Tax=Winogradskyella eximia TaxID=262006 RepID=A0A3D9H9W3_9FLAO|nr:hypothetical protein DFQ10_10143 [Winogradskyella eximia]
MGFTIFSNEEHLNFSHKNLKRFCKKKNPDFSVWVQLKNNSVAMRLNVFYFFNASLISINKSTSEGPAGAAGSAGFLVLL